MNHSGPVSSAESKDVDWIKETRRFEEALLKELAPDELNAELWGYARAAEAKVPTARIFGTVGHFLVVERVSGMTCHQMIRDLGARDPVVVSSLLDTLWADVGRFQLAAQREPDSADGVPRPVYPVPYKLASALNLLNAVEPSLATRLQAGIDSFWAWFQSAAVTPFRDAAPRNCVLADTQESADSHLAAASGWAGRRHIDFRSTLESTTAADDYLSVILHAAVPPDYRERRLHELVKLTSVEDVVGTAVLRTARLWGRRAYYLESSPAQFRDRYGEEGDSLAYFESLLVDFAEQAIDMGLFG